MVHVKREFKKVKMSFFLFIDIRTGTAGSFRSIYICRIMYNTSLVTVYSTVGLITRALNDNFYMFIFKYIRKITLQSKA